MRTNLQARAAQIKALFLDVDGVLTDGTLQIGANGELSKNFNVKDGLALSCALRAGLHLALITGRNSAIVRYRAQELGITEVAEGVNAKGRALQELAEKFRLDCAEIAYMGDDLNDLPALNLAGLACAPADAAAEVREVCAFVTESGGGRGAVRQVVELILRAQGKWDNLVQAYAAQKNEVKQ